MAHTNPDNKLKCDVAGFKGWMPTRFLMAKGPDGTKYVTPGFKNVLTDEEHVGLEPPGPTGDLAHIRHAGDLYRQNYDLINWSK
jgi:hypothetical protein